MNWRKIMLLGWVLGLFLMINDFFIHYEQFFNGNALDTIFIVIKDLLSDLFRFPPHHFWVGFALFYVLFLLDLFYKEK